MLTSIQTMPTGLFGPGLIVALVSRRLRVPEQIRVVVERRLPVDRGDLPVAGRQRIFFAAGRDRREEDEGAVSARDAERRLVLRNLHGDVGGRRIRRRLRRVGVEGLDRGDLDLRCPP